MFDDLIFFFLKRRRLLEVNQDIRNFFMNMLRWSGALAEMESGEEKLKSSEKRAHLRNPSIALGFSLQSTPSVKRLISHESENRVSPLPVTGAASQLHMLSSEDVILDGAVVKAKEFDLAIKDRKSVV